MDNNDFLRRFRYALDIPDSTMVNLFKRADIPVDEAKFRQLLLREEEKGYVHCSDLMLERFLDALILYNRGPQENDKKRPSSQNKWEQNGGKEAYSTPKKISPELPLSNNMILKKLRIALELKQEEMQTIFELGGLQVGKGELTAFFRNEHHKNYKPCGDQYLKKFMNGLGVRHRMG